MSNLIIASKSKLNTLAKIVKDGLEVSSGSRSTSTYYHTREQQIQATRKAVQELYAVDKSLPLLLASLDDSTFFYRQEVLKNEFKRGYSNGTMSLVNQSVWLDQRLQEKIIVHIVNSLPLTYALRLFIGMRDEKINATRATRILVSWILSNMNDFSVVKYRNKMKRGLIHGWGKTRYSAVVKNLKKYLNNEVHDADFLNKHVFSLVDRTENTLLAKLILFVAGEGKPEWYQGTKFIKAFHTICDADSDEKFFETAKLLDYHTVTGIISSYPNQFFKSFFSDNKLKKEVKARLLSNSTVMTDDQKVRTKKLQEKVGGVARTDIDFKKVSTETIYKTQGVEEQKEIRAEADKIALPYNKIGIIRDISISNRGGKDSTNTPAVIIEHMSNVLRNSAPNVIGTVTEGANTDLTKPFIEIVNVMPDVEAIFILSDGYENYPYDGCLNDMVKKFKQLNPNSNLQLIHCSPYSAAEMGAKSREIGSEIISLPVTKPSQLATQMNIRLLDFDPKKYFEDNFSKFLTFNQKVMSRVVEEMF